MLIATLADGSGMFCFIYFVLFGSFSIDLLAIGNQ